MKMKLATVDGSDLEVEGHRFAHYVDNCRFLFFYHRSPDGIGWQVSEWKTRKKVCDILPLYNGVCLKDKKAAAKMAIDQLCARHGAEKVKAVLSGSEEIRK